jgi:Flp pilus assembly pilin Flp
MYKRKHKAQSTVEYAVLIAIVAAAFVGMQIYLKRGIQGRVRDMAEQISSTHYERKNTDSAYTTTQSGTMVTEYDRGIARTYQDGTHGSTGDTMTRSGNETVYPDE